MVRSKGEASGPVGAGTIAPPEVPTACWWVGRDRRDMCSPDEG